MYDETENGKNTCESTPTPRLESVSNTANSGRGLK